MVSQNHLLSNRNHIIIGMIFLLIGVLATAEMAFTFNSINSQHRRLEEQIQCNTELIDVLQKRADARNMVDIATADAQTAFIAYLNDIADNGTLAPHDAHVINLRDKYAEAVQARENPDLNKPYPNC